VIPSAPIDVQPILVGSAINRKDDPSRFAHRVNGLSPDGSFIFTVCKNWFRGDEARVDDVSPLCPKCTLPKTKSLAPVLVKASTKKSVKK
jgi:hypothetical protein